MRDGAQILVNISNDTWLGGAAAAVVQHFSMAVFRAVENKRPLVRAATAGISGFVDPTGRPSSLSTAAGTVIRGEAFPRHELTVYARYGDWFSLACVGFSLVALLGVAATRQSRIGVPRACTSTTAPCLTAGRILRPPSQRGMRTGVQPHGRRGTAMVFVAVLLGLALTTGMTSARWLGTVFPGFFVMANKVVASVSLPHWPVASHRHIYQHAVVAVNGQPVATSDELYAIVRRFPAGSALTYTLEKDGRITQATLPSLTFTPKAYFLLFGAYLFTGLAVAFIGISVWFLTPGAPASVALFIASVTLGLFFLTAADLYAPHWFFRLHVLSEAMFPASFVHLALVFPVDRVRRSRPFVLSTPYLVALALAAAYEVFLDRPAAYSLMHSLCEVYAGSAGPLFLGTILWSYHTTGSHLIRQRIRIIFLGFLGAFALPVALTLLSGLMGGGMTVNYAVFTIGLFPLSLGYAIVKHDLFEIDALLKRGAYYLALTAALVLLYIAFLALLNFTLRFADLARSPLFPLLFTLIAVLLLNPLKDYLQRGVDRVFFRLQYNPKKELEVTSASLASTLQLEEILSLIWRTINETVGVKQGGILLLGPGKEHYAFAYPHPGTEHCLAASHPLIQGMRRQKGRVFSWFDLANDALPLEMRIEGREEFARIGVQLLVPLIFKGDLVGLIALGRKESGTFFSADDHDFLYTLANQSALSIANALAYREIQELNASLEKKVEERTQALAYANTELQSSVEQLEQAYRDLQHSQESLLRAEKMAMLGRLAAGIAHEMNTPLGASLTSLKLLQELVEEYRASIGDREVSERDHQDIAAEMDRLVCTTQQWMEKAAAHIRSLKLHTRGLQQREIRSFSVAHVIADAALLLSHRLRLSQCTLSVSCPAPEPILQGDPSKLGQVLTNLVVNAIDAYKGTDRNDGEIRVEVTEDGDCLEIRVSDQGCGIPPEHLGKIFDELFSTKALGEGTGLGLSIARDIITNFFAGTISVESEPGRGSTFTLRLPRGDRTTPGQSLFAEETSQTLERCL